MKILKLDQKKVIAIFFYALISIFIITTLALASSDEASGKKGWVETDTYRVMNFTVLALALFLILRKPVSNALSSRIDEIKNQLSELEEKKRDAENKLSAYQAKIASLSNEAEDIISQYIKQGNETKDKIIKEAENAKQKIENQAQKNIEYTFMQAKLSLQKDILEKALVKAEQLITKKISKKDQQALIDDYLKKVVI